MHGLVRKSSVPVAVIILLSAVFNAGCRREPVSDADAAAFVTAVNGYLDAKSMAMRVHDVKTLTISGDQATMTASLEQADGAAGIKVRWTFRLTRRAGGWRIAGHES